MLYLQSGRFEWYFHRKPANAYLSLTEKRSITKLITQIENCERYQSLGQQVYNEFII